MAWIMLILFIVLAIVGRVLYENCHIQKTVYEFKSTKVKEDTTFIFLSDLHNQSFGKNNRKLIEQIEKENPDYILIGGDMLVGKKGEIDQHARNAWKLLQGIVNKFPVFYVNGNHETRMKFDTEKYGEQYTQYEEKLKKMGVSILNNDSLFLEEKGIQINGLELEEEYYKKRRAKDLTVTEIEQRLDKTAKDRFQILLAHKPEYFMSYAGWGADLTLSGHNHGGMIRLPLIGGIVSTQYRVLPKYDGGLYTKEEKYMIVSRGLGGHTIKVRLMNVPDFVIIHISPK